jgi:hypothetical protein
MAGEVEITTLDLRYEVKRMRDKAQEARLMTSIAERGIEEPLEGVVLDRTNVLLNGFKRYRCARKLGIAAVPYASLGEDEAMGIIGLLRASNNKALGILEQAGFIDDLKTVHRMTSAEIATELSRSKAWVSMRLGLMKEMSEVVRRKLFRGEFPTYSYMYAVRQFMRMNSVTKAEVEQFVVALSGKNLSVREIEQLLHGYFRGPESFREQIRNGNVALPLEWVRQKSGDAEGCSPFEKTLLKDLEIVGRYMQRVMGKGLDPKLKSQAFHAQANLLTGGILSRNTAFIETLRKLHDRTGKA